MYLFEREGASEHACDVEGAEGEKLQADPILRAEPDVGSIS